MEIETLAKLLAPTLTAILVFFIKKYFESRPKLITYMVHASAIPLHNEENGSVNTHSIVVRNSGKKTAKNVRIGHNYLPQSFQLHPQLTHEIIRGDNGAAEILIPTLVPDEQLNISYLYFPPNTWHNVHSYCKSDEMNAKYVNVVPSAQLNKIQLSLLYIVLFVGASSIVYWLFFRVWALVQ
ncbi:hypothetical protein [Aquipseudomonas guryensis]|uniref:Uncharacterized protein n=1 Tax=Aquipseudomonas guryensis TaxID=2759165 RepID=A0A7W4DC56_9GAMM|nr:hypothetical protein [Pseudomonas guryensis]MBB1519901.1 hypothetical protein [Pseudomonas guryensis]